MSLKYLYLSENVNNDLVCLMVITKIICSCWLTVGSWIMFVVFLNKTFHWCKYVCIKKWTYKQGCRKCGNREGAFREIAHACRKLISCKSSKIK